MSSAPQFRIPFPRKRLLGAWLNLPVRMRLHTLARRYHARHTRQLVVFSHDHIADSINLDGVYEGEFLTALMAWLKALNVNLSDATALDIGANIGNHSLFFSDYVKHVHAFEPNALTYKVLSINASLVSNVTPHNFGLSNHTGEATLHINPENIGYSSITPALKVAQHSASATIQLKSLDEALSASVGTIKLLKIDVEGHEPEVIAGAASTIRQHAPIILFEQHTGDFVNGTSPAIQRLQSLGYAQFAIIDRKPSSNGKRLLKLVSAAVNLLKGPSMEVTLVTTFTPGFYPFIVALPGWLKDAANTPAIPPAQ